jgi:hypothetical protein
MGRIDLFLLWCGVESPILTIRYLISIRKPLTYWKIGFTLTFNRENKMQIISRRRYESGINYMRAFDYTDKVGGGFAFPSNDKGEVDLAKLTVEGLANYMRCVSGDYRVKDCGVVSYPWRCIHPAVGLCDHCQSQVSLEGFTNTCECGADFNMSGQILSHRSNWGNDTGESIDDILSVDNSSIDSLFDCQ